MNETNPTGAIDNVAVRLRDEARAIGLELTTFLYIANLGQPTEGIIQFRLEVDWETSEEAPPEVPSDTADIDAAFEQMANQQREAERKERFNTARDRLRDIGKASDGIGLDDD